jgi:hypothetical protein
MTTLFRTDDAYHTSALPLLGARAAARDEWPQPWEVTLVCKQTSKPLHVDGIVLTWFTRHPDDTVEELMEGRDPSEWAASIRKSEGRKAMQSADRHSPWSFACLADKALAAITIPPRTAYDLP